MKDIHWWLEYKRTIVIGLPIAALCLIKAMAAATVPIVPVILNALGSALISAVVIRMMFEHVGRYDLANAFEIVKAHSETGLDDVTFSVQRLLWLPFFMSARHVTIIWLRLNFVENPECFDALRNILVHGGSVTIILSDPRSDAMKLRYREEPHPSPYGTDPLGWSNGLEQLCIFAGMLYDWKVKLGESGVDVSKLRVAVFPHYPTSAIYRFDNVIYTYGYPYKRRGFNGPLFKFRVASPVEKFFLECLDEMTKSSINLEDAIDDIMNKRSAGILSDAVVLGGRPPRRSRS